MIAQADESLSGYNGFDYERQAWVVSGRYVSCAHPDSMGCTCYGKLHAGELALCGNCCDGCKAEKPCDGCEEVLCVGCWNEHNRDAADHESPDLEGSRCQVA